MPSKKNGPIDWRLILSGFFLLRALTIVAATAGISLLSFKNSFPYADAVLEPYGSPLFWSWANFDGVHYLLLAQKGYAFGLTQAYFPVYFLLIRWLHLLVNNYLLSALAISHLAFLGALFVFYKLVCLDAPKGIATRSLLSLVFFPTAFFFFAAYTESLFLFLIVLSFFLFRKKRYLLGGIVGVMASATRLVGIFLVPAFLYEFWVNKKREPKALLGSLLPGLGLLGYMVYLKNRFGDPLMFVNVQEAFGGGRTTEKLVLLYQVFWRYFKMILTVDPHNPIYFAVWLELLAAGAFLGLLIWAWIKGIRKSYLIFSFSAYLLPTLTGTFSSIPRYVLALFPAFMVLGMLKNRYLFWLVMGIFLILLFASTLLFTRGYWVA